MANLVCGVRALLAAVLSSPVLSGCSCRPLEPICTQVDQVSVAFVGVPVETNDNPRAPDVDQKIWYRFVVEEPLRGLPDTAREIMVDPNSGSSCQMSFDLGEKYLVLAYGQRLPRSPASVRDLRLITGTCTGTRLARYATDDIAYLRRLANDPPPASVFGLVTLHGNERFSREPNPPILSAEVWIDGAGIQRSTNTDDSGRYEFTDVPAGDYALSVKAVGLQSFHQTYALQVKPHGCGLAYVGMYANGALSGQVVDGAGNPVAGTKVVYLPANEQTPAVDLQASQTITDEQGRYLFAEVAPGDYSIGVETDRPPVLRRDVIPTFWPGGERTSRSPAIHLALNETKADLTIPVRLTTTRNIQVRVVFPDGHPASKAGVYASAGKEDLDVAKTGSNGIAKIQVLSGISYIFRAVYAPEDDDLDTTAPPRDRSESEPVAAPRGDDWTGVTLVLREDASLQ